MTSRRLPVVVVDHASKHGMPNNATDGFDGLTLDAPKPPPPPTSLRVAFLRPAWRCGVVPAATQFQTDTRSPVGQVAKVWDFVVSRNAGPDGRQSVQLTRPT